MTKDEIRSEMRGRLQTTAAVLAAETSGRIVEAIWQLDAWRTARLICAFLPMRREPQIQALWREEKDRAFCFPRISPSGLELIRITDQALLAALDWRMTAPELAGCPIVQPREIDLILVPGVAFTRDGHRLGRGGGYYDRLLAACPSHTRRIGVSYACQVVEALPVEGHDQTVEMLITELSGQR